MTTRIDIIDRALMGIGSNPLVNEAGPGAPAKIARYTLIVEDLLSRYPWTFAKKKRQLARLAAAPAAHWKYAYERPADMLGVPRAMYDSAAEDALPFLDYELQESGVLSSAAALWALYTIDKPPWGWPGFFKALVDLALRADYALSVREDSVLRDKLLREAFGPPEQHGEGGLFAQAKAVDTMAQPSPILSGGRNPLIDVRF